MSLPDPSEVLAVLRAIESGEVTVTMTPETAQEYAYYSGHTEYLASNGWRVTVFWDCDGWDEIAHVTAPDGREVDYKDFVASQDAHTDADGNYDCDQDPWAAIRNYQPSDEGEIKYRAHPRSDVEW